MTVRIEHDKQNLTASRIDALDCLIIISNQDISDIESKSIGYFADIKSAIEAKTPTKGQPFKFNLLNTRLTHVCWTQINQQKTTFDQLTINRLILTEALSSKTQKLGVLLPGWSGEEKKRLQQALVSAVLSITHALPEFKRKTSPGYALKTLTFFESKQKNFSRVIATASGNNLARTLTHLPANKLTPLDLNKQIKSLAQQYNWYIHCYDLAELQKLQAGAFLAVTRASSAGAGIIKLTYTPKVDKPRKPMSLVGKGVCFDSGGLNLKPTRSMQHMNHDMAGAAAALGTLIALSELKVDFQITCWLAIADNNIGRAAYRPSDVVSAANGVTIEVVHTDAEGRMLLADTLVLADRENPAMIIDFATLTGSCVNALSTRYSGAFTNRDAYHHDIIAAGITSGERIWPFPFDEDFDQALESKVADIKQCLIEGTADHIYAARFLNRFVSSTTPWIHIDLSAAHNDGGLGHIPSDVTGFGVRFAVDFILDRDWCWKND